MKILFYVCRRLNIDINRLIIVCNVNAKWSWIWIWSWIRVQWPYVIFVFVRHMQFTALRCTESSIRLEMSFRIECESMATDIKINVTITITIIIVGFIIANDIPAFSALIHIIRSNSMRFVSIRSNPIQSNPYTHRVSGNEATCHNKKYFNSTTTPHPLYLTILPWQIRKT